MSTQNMINHVCPVDAYVGEPASESCAGKKALIAMSGGVDSSVAALLTMRAGYICIGCTMKLYEPPEEERACARSCCALEDVEDARAVCYKLGIPYYVFNLKDEFRSQVIEKFIRSYEQGLTPNPCIDCNRYLKFSKLYERAKILGCDKIVTGHYARIEERDGRFFLRKAADLTKDQSYVLYAMTQEQLAHTLFPLGELRKTEVRKTAQGQSFPNAIKPDSQDICFVRDGDYAKTIQAYTGKEYAPGPFLSTDGRILGEHKGLIRYTVGQRRGLGIAAAEPLYVCRILPEQNEIVLGHRRELFSRTAQVHGMNWISGEAPAEAFRCHAKIRYRQAEQPATVYPQGENATIVFDLPQRAITPGQAAVLYDADIVLGGGEIVSAE